MRSTKRVDVVVRKRIVEREHRHRVPHLGEAPGRRDADLQRQAFQRAQVGKALLDRAVALAQRVVLGVRDRRRVVLVVALVVLADLGMQPRVLGLGLLFGEVVDGDLRDRHAPATAHPAALISRSAAVRASSVISAPASMRAISSRRRSAATSVTLVATRLPRAERVLGDEIVPVGARRDLRRMRHRHHLHLRGEAREPLPDRVRDRAADAGVDLVEHQRRRRAAVRQHDLQRQQEARELAARRDLHQRARPRARIGLAPRTRCGRCRPARRASVSMLVEEARALELERLELRRHGLVELRRRLLARRRQRGRGLACTLRPPRAPPLRASSSPPRRHRSPRDRRHASRAAPRDRPPRHCICVRRRAARTAAPRCARARADRDRRRAAPRRDGRAPRRARSARHRAPSRPDRSARAPARARRSSRRSAADSAGDRRTRRPRPPRARRANPRATLSTCIIAARFSASAVSSPVSGLSLRQLLDRVAQIVRLAPRLLDARAMRVDRLLGGAARGPQRATRRRRRHSRPA